MNKVKKGILYSMKILIIGSGAREHALAWKIAQSEKADVIFAAPGNGGTAAEAKTQNIPLNGFTPESEEGQDILLDFAKNENIDLTIVGPEAPLDAGIADKFTSAGLPIIGPLKKAARLETSKIFARSFMTKYGIPCAKSRNFRDYNEAASFAEKHFAKPPKKKQEPSQPVRENNNPLPLVIKADGLAAGKGVVIAYNADEAKKTLRSFMRDSTLGEAGKNILMEDYLEGFEVSVLAAVSVMPGKKGVIVPFLPAMDHKSIFDGGMGPNTGGMGAIAPVPEFTSVLQREFAKSILLPTLKGMEAEKMEYRGFIFFGLMISQNSLYLLEYNVRLGDPETQVLLPLMETDLLDLCMAVNNGSLSNNSIQWKEGSACAPVIAAENYPGTPRKGDAIAINFDGMKINGSNVFIAGAERGTGGALGSGLRTTGGRVLTVSAHGRDAEDAYRKAYDAVRFINFEGMQFRKDIGKENRKINYE